ncbi:hypothetical protein TIFTF001_022029 [Ficus carica]|uniref:Uncharacterized protein n=1 Tax=Ficus carica TaxID=3494 RepID=A0AA88DF62_FICCA|nr:hypothetical protein TIFTF001_022029 [Ficus carica]
MEVSGNSINDGSEISDETKANPCSRRCRGIIDPTRPKPATGADDQNSPRPIVSRRRTPVPSVGSVRPTVGGSWVG